MPHLDDGVLHAMVDGEIHSAELAAVQAHLASCDLCRARLDEAREFAAEARMLVEQVEPPGAGRQDGGTAGRRGGGLGSWRRLAWAASLVLAVGLGYGIGAGGPGREPEAVEAPGSTPLPVTPPAAQAANEGTAARRDQAAAPVPEAARAAGRETEQREAKSEAAPRNEVPTEVAAAVAVPSAPAAAVVAAPPPASAKGVSGLAAGERMAMRRQALDEADRYTETGFAEAVALLGGRLRLIDGLAPERLERSGVSVRVTYPGPMYLLQHRQGDSVTVRLIAPGVTADSVARLLAKVR